MEPRERRMIELRKAINAHENAQLTLIDLIAGNSQSEFAQLLQRVEQNLATLQQAAEAMEEDDLS